MPQSIQDMKPCCALCIPSITIRVPNHAFPLFSHVHELPSPPSFRPPIVGRESGRCSNESRSRREIGVPLPRKLWVSDPSSPSVANVDDPLWGHKLFPRCHHPIQDVYLGLGGLGLGLVADTSYAPRGMMMESANSVQDGGVVCRLGPGTWQVRLGKAGSFDMQMMWVWVVQT